MSAYDTLAAAARGTFIGIEITKQGVLRGKGDERKRYNDARVHVTLVSGFSYTGLVVRSLKLATKLGVEEVMELAQKEDAMVFSHEEIELALENTIASLQRTLDKGQPPRKQMKPLIVNGAQVIGSMVDDDDVTHVHGLKIQERTISQPPNGWFVSASKRQTLANKAVRALLPISKHRSYKLAADSGWVLNAGRMTATEEILLQQVLKVA